MSHPAITIFLKNLIACLFVAPTLLLANDELNDYYDLSLEELLSVEITGSTLTPEYINTVPSAVTVLTHNQIKRMGFDYLHELLNLVPGFQSQLNSERSMAFGYSSRGRRVNVQSKEVLLLIDGRPMNDPRNGGTDSILRMLPLEQIERVEIIRGPGSAIYGSNAYTGVINIITRSGENEVELTAGSYKRVKGHGLWSHQQDSWQLDLFAHAENDNGQTYSVQDTFSANQIDTSDPRQFVYVDMAMRYKDTLLRTLVYQSEGDDFYSLGTLSNGFNRNESTHNQISLEQDVVWLDYLRSYIYLGYLQGTSDFNTQATAPGELAAISAPSSTAPLKGIATTRREGYRFRWHNDWQHSSFANTQFGLEWRKETEIEAKVKTNFDIAQLAAGNVPVTSTDGFDQVIAFGTESSRMVLGLYGQYQYTWADSMHLTLGARYDDYSRAGSRFSPRLGLVHMINENHTLKLLYGEAFLAPALNETGLINNRIVAGNPYLEHEVAKTWDMIWMGSWVDTHVSLGWFHNRYENAIIRGQIGPTRTFINGADEKSQGFEVEVHQQLADEWLLIAGLTRITDLPDSAFRETATMGSILINFEQARWNWNLAAIYTGKREMLTPGDIRLSLNDYWLVNSKIRYEMNKNWHTFIRVKNLFDKDYLTAAEGNSLTEGIPNRGREWELGVAYHF